MNIVGFISEHESISRPNLGIPLKELFNGLEITPSKLSKIIDYLQNAKCLISKTLFFFDTENNPIGSYIIYTDGKWLWPSYYVYYMKMKSRILIPNDFIKNIESNNFINPILTDEEVHNAELYYMRIFPPSKSANVRPKIEELGLLNKKDNIPKWWK